MTTAKPNAGRILLTLFFVSGICGLIYEVAWTRLITPLIGNTAFSISSVLAVFMGGLALGSRWVGAHLDHNRTDPVRLYAVLELCIGVYNLLLPALVQAADLILGSTFVVVADYPAAANAVHLLITILLFLVPSTLMGATLPALVRASLRMDLPIGFSIGRAYTVNTLGAAAGTVVAGFGLLPWIGVTATLWTAGVLNVWIAGVSWKLGAAPVVEPVEARDEVRLRGPLIVLAVMAASGFATLVNEVAWTRVLSLIVGPTTYAFTLMLAAMILGLGIGSAMGSAWVRRRPVTVSTLGALEFGIALSSVALVPLFGRMPVWIARLVTVYVESFRTIQLAEFGIFFLLLSVPTILMGIAFPVAAALYVRSASRPAGDLGVIYAVNTIGAIAGSLACGFAFIRFLGSERSLIVASAVSFVAGCVLVWRTASGKAAGASVAVLLAGIVWFSPRWEPELMTSGAYKYAPYYPEETDLESVLKTGRILYFKEGLSGTVTVRKLRQSTVLAIDGKVDATDAGDMTTQKMLAHLPMLLSPDPRRVAVIGLGSGVTAGSVLRYPVERLDVLEISPEVVEGSTFFAHVNGKPFDDRRTRLRIGDGRNALRYSQDRYDVIISEPSNPWMAGIGALFGAEFFREIRNRLAPGGILCQWVHSYNMSTDDLRTIVATLRSEFRHAGLWTLNENDYLLLASESPFDWNAERTGARMTSVAADLESIALRDLFTLASLLQLEDKDLDRFAGAAPINSDDLPILEYRAPQSIYANTAQPNLTAVRAVERAVARPDWIAAVLRSPTAEQQRNRGDMLRAAESLAEAAAAYQAALELDPLDSRSWDGLLAAVSARTKESIDPFIDRIAVRKPAAAPLYVAKYFAKVGDNARAIAVLDDLLKTAPNDVAALLELSDALANDGDARLPGVLDRLFALAPEHPRGLFHLATVRLYQGRQDEAIRLVRRSLEQDPSNQRARNLLAIAYGQTFQKDRADAEFRGSIEADPNDWISYNNYGLFLLEHGDATRAAEQFQTSLDINSQNVQALVGMGESLRQRGDTRSAEAWYRRALRLDPNHPIARQYAPGGD